MKSPKPPITQKQFVINNLRRASYRWGPRNAAKQKAKIGRNQYVCNLCKKVVGNKDIKIDHILPVVCPHTGFVDWNTYVARLLCEESGYQALCRICHDKKTDEEREVRKKAKRGFQLINKKARKNRK